MDCHHIATTEHIRSFRSCPHATGPSMADGDRVRISRSELAGRERRRRPPFDAECIARKGPAVDDPVESAAAGPRSVLPIEGTETDRQQILGLLISTHEEVVHLNDDLEAREEQLARANRTLAGLYRIAKGLNRATSQQEAVEQVIEEAMELPGVQAVWIVLQEGDASFRLAGARGLPPALQTPDAMEGDCSCRRRLLSGELSQVTNILECERLQKAQGDTRGLRCHASVPLWAGDRTVGVMNLVGSQDGLLSDEELQVLNGIGNHIALALERARLREHLEAEVEDRTAALRLEINERELAQDALRRSEERYRMLAEAAHDDIVIINRDGCIEYINNSGAERYGVPAAQLFGKRIADLFPPETSAQLAAVIGKIFETGEPIYQEIAMTFPHQKVWLGMWLVSLESTAGKAEAVLAVARDITERKRAEESRRLQSAALHAAADAIVITDRAGVIEWVNPAFTQITGYTAEEALGKNPRDLVKSGKHTPALYKDLWETILGGRTWHGEIINRRKDGRLYTERQAVTPILDASGAITHFVAIKQDITERLELEAQFRQAQKMESVGQLTSGIAHDFNNLVTVINGMSDLVLAQVSEDNPVHADVQEIAHAGERAATLTRQLLAFSRQQILEPRVLDVRTLVAGMEDLLRRVLGEDIDLVVVPTPGLGSVKADPGQLEQVITNLAVNARDAMPQGGRLTIETQNIELDEAYARRHGEAVAPGSYVRLTVSDSGAGMDEATRARIFEPFFTTKGPGKGTGLGLSTVFGIVRQSHGFVSVCSKVGRGTSFQILLPQVTEAAGPDPAEPIVAPPSGTETILLAEDNAGLRRLATRILEPAGYTVLGAPTGEEALRLLERHEEPVLLLLSDVVMPGMSGRHLAEQLAQIRPGMKVLYMSGYTSDTIVRHGVLEAQVPFLNKPFTAAALLRKVREVLDS